MKLLLILILKKLLIILFFICIWIALILNTTIKLFCKEYPPKFYTYRFDKALGLCLHIFSYRKIFFDLFKTTFEKNIDRKQQFLENIHTTITNFKISDIKGLLLKFKLKFKEMVKQTLNRVRIWFIIKYRFWSFEIKYLLKRTYTNLRNKKT